MVTVLLRLRDRVATAAGNGRERGVVRQSIYGALLAVAVVGAACSFTPRIGMSFDDWNRQCRAKALAGGTLLEQKGTTAVYYCGTQEVLYRFENGALTEVKNQPAYGATQGLKLTH